jgi:hypothetical protein
MLAEAHEYRESQAIDEMAPSERARYLASGDNRRATVRCTVEQASM